MRLIRSPLSFRSGFLFSLHNVFKFTKINSASFQRYSSGQNHDSDDYDEDVSDDEYLNQQDLMSDIFQYNRLTDLSPQNVFVVMPRQKRGDSKMSHDRAESLLDETVALVQSVPYFSVKGAQMISTKAIDSEKIFGSTNLDNLRANIRQEKADTVVFSIDVLKPKQHLFFQRFLDAQILDRFSLVLKIFRERCSTKEAKLQLELAELDYIKRNLHHMRDCDFKQLFISKKFGGNFDAFYQDKKQLIQDRESRLKKALNMIQNNNEVKRQSRNTLEMPSVAIVGYTNSGKTSLIKALTHDSSLNPEDRLFATLNVTTHEMTLPSKLKALLIDTIGFISEIPTTLIHCFRSTLREICQADLIVHVIDASHPDRDIQIETVHQTLKEIEVPDKLLETMIEVSNKVDKVDDFDEFLDTGNTLPISATERIGLDQLARKIELAIIQNTDRLALEIRVPNGGEKYQWLYREATIVDCRPDDVDANSMIMRVIMTKSKVGRFHKLFYKNNNDDNVDRI